MRRRPEGQRCEWVRLGPRPNGENAVLDDQGKIDLIGVHAKCEREKNWAGALATMIDEAPYQWFPYRIRVSGPETVTTMWERTSVLRCLNYDTGRKVLSMERCLNHDSAVDTVHNTFPGEDGSLVPTTFLAIFHFDGDKIIKETIHLDSNMVPYMDEVFADPEFLSLPGVERF
jgi:hypothetical protein